MRQSNIYQNDCKTIASFTHLELPPNWVISGPKALLYLKSALERMADRILLDRVGFLIMLILYVVPAGSGRRWLRIE